MENVNNTTSTAEENLTERLNSIKDEAVGEALEETADNIVAEVMMAAALANVKTGKFTKDNRNMIGGAIGLGIAVGLELLSPTGSKKSALVAGVVGGAALYMAAPYLKIAPQSTGIAAAAGAVTAYAGMIGGRITADYFPGNIDLDDE